ncbi:metallophosphoesterase family protein [Microcystis aeruginosa]|uniref:metallophosphoesterase family protein n=1 Tax=Microcystis aeruginosa TaxID=1126 RepID=UPI0023311CB4|nr:metallophosphoesterase [Microcystis aeruginosa]MDB9390235.1 metallophosphoesterase [Microcystis aeruginosa CS-579]
MNFRFAILSDPHIALPTTILNHSNRFHLVEVSIPALKIVLDHLITLNLDFLLIAGDLTQDGEPENHRWLADCLATLPFPVYVVPGNHDVLSLTATENQIGLADFPFYYQQFGYGDPEQIYYQKEILPGVQLIGLNSNQFDDQGKQIGSLDAEQLHWLKQTLPALKNDLVMVMIHHNVIEHLPGQSNHELGKRYMLANAVELLDILQENGVKLLITGHLHVQDLAFARGIYEITTGSLVSYPHPYRVLEYCENTVELAIESFHLQNIPGWENLPAISRQWLGDRSYPFMMRLLTCHPLNLPMSLAEELAPKLRNFWADVAKGDTIFDFSDFPPLVRRYFYAFSAIDPLGNPHFIDNQAVISFKHQFSYQRSDLLVELRE